MLMAYIFIVPTALYSSVCSWTFLSPKFGFTESVFICYLSYFSFIDQFWIGTPDIWKINHVQTIKDLHKNFFHNLRCKKSEVKLLRLSHFPVKFNARIWSNSQAKIGVQVPKSQRGQNSTENQIFHYEDLLIKMKSLL